MQFVEDTSQEVEEDLNVLWGECMISKTPETELG